MGRQCTRSLLDHFYASGITSFIFCLLNMVKPVSIMALVWTAIKLNFVGNVSVSFVSHFDKHN